MVQGKGTGLFCFVFLFIRVAFLGLLVEKTSLHFFGAFVTPFLCGPTFGALYSVV